MKRRTQILCKEEDLLVDLIFHRVPTSILAEFAEKIVNPYYRGSLNVAIQDLIQKALAEQDFLLSHMTHVRNPEAQVHG